ncbi:MAG: NAD-dependent epimerase/dehydratase family protein [Nitrosopumilus sp.]|uniref:NAD-dependent epimerase/dehydratase family protein n=1 Tax=Nitrosopumilus sp. TaxID=2024843 RepID=UPI00247E196C|nr:NAD-dependent epimerase/dehydratase family protein [Nitrosopumilus sp.]MCV0392937.1 NAD-dependent epimerase/dehydratase family protein [Nitrosopumilus sp.]
MKILVTGGAGFIGRYLVESLKKNHTVLVYDNLSNSKKIPDEKNVKFCKGDILDYDNLCKFSKDVDIMIHLAALTNVTESVIDPENTIDVNVNGTANVIKACNENKIKKIIFASSAAVYGDNSEIISENTKTDPLSAYGNSKIEAEKIIVKRCNENKISYIILRIFNVYGKGQNEKYAGVITKFAKNILQKKPVVIHGNGKQTRDFVSIHDVIDAFLCAIESKSNGVYNIASGKSLSINELANMMFDVFGKVEIKHLAKQKGDIQNSNADITLAKEQLHFIPTRKLKKELASIYHE